MQLGRLVVMAQLMLAGLGGAAGASGPRLVVVQPATGFLSYGHTPFDQPSATQRVVIRNDGDPVGYEDIYVSGPFQIIASGGGLGAGEVKFWDIACVPTDPDGSSNTGVMDIDVCGSSCEDEWRESLWLFCQAGLLETPDTNVFLFAYAYSSAQETVSFTNPGPDPLTVTSLATHDPMSSLALASGTLPVTLAAGDSIDVIATFNPTGSGEVFTYADVVAGTAVAGRVLLRAETRSQIALAAGFYELPLGASYSFPITVRNSYPSARMITAVTSDHPDDVVTGLTGVRLAPGEVANGFVTVTASALGFRQTMLTLEFDAGQGDIARFGNYIVPATYAVTASDATPNDGTIDFGTRKAGSAPVEQTFTITNLTAIDEPVSGCDGPIAPFELVGTCPTVLPANGSVQLTVRFTPTTAGAFVYSVALNLASFHHIVGLLNARVVATQLAFSSAELAFPDTMLAASAQRHVTITNLAANPITVPITVTGASFAASAAEVTIPGGETAEVLVEFAPTAPGMFTGALEIGVEGDPDRAIIALSGTGLGVNQPPPDGGSGRGDGGGCNTGGGAGGLAIAMLALVRRRRVHRGRPGNARSSPVMRAIEFSSWRSCRTANASQPGSEVFVPWHGGR